MLDPVAHQADATPRIASELSDPVGSLEVASDVTYDPY